MHVLSAFNPSNAEATFAQCTLEHKNLWKPSVNPVMLVLIGKLSLSTFRWVPICQGFGDLLLFQACTCVTLPLLREEVIMLNNILPQQWECHTCICFQQMELLLLYGVLSVAPSRMLQQQLSLDLHLKQKVCQKHVCKPCDIMGIDHGR